VGLISVDFFFFCVEGFYGHDALENFVVGVCSLRHILILLFVNCLLERKKIVIAHGE